MYLPDLLQNETPPVVIKPIPGPIPQAQPDDWTVTCMSTSTQTYLDVKDAKIQTHKIDTSKETVSTSTQTDDITPVVHGVGDPQSNPRPNA